MNTDQIVTASSISTKIIAFFIFTAIEIVCNTISFFVDFDIKGKNLLQPGSRNSPNMNIQYYIAFAMMG